jgi:hypothetical protein
MAITRPTSRAVGSTRLSYRFFFRDFVGLFAVEVFPLSRLSDLMTACIAALAAAVAASVAALTAILCMRAAPDFATPMTDDLGFRADGLLFLFTDKLLSRMVSALRAFPERPG